MKLKIRNLNFVFKHLGPPDVNTVWYGPEYDHSIGGRGGSYLYLMIAQNIRTQFTRIGVIESMVAPLLSPKCLSFWTQLRGADTSIEVILVRYGESVPKTNQTYTLSAPNSIVGTKNVWTQIKLNIDPKQFPFTKVFAVRIKGKVSNLHSFIALDDVMLTDGDCGTRPQPHP